MKFEGFFPNPHLAGFVVFFVAVWGGNVLEPCLFLWRTGGSARKVLKALVRMLDARLFARQRQCCLSFITYRGIPY